MVGVVGHGVLGVSVVEDCADVDGFFLLLLLILE